jgi:hypothetical protein
MVIEAAFFAALRIDWRRRRVVHFKRRERKTERRETERERERERKKKRERERRGERAPRRT